jgi:FkbM family methyltransferase
MLARYIPGVIKTILKRFLQPRTLVMSQAGQDFFVYGEVFNEMKNGYFLDLGALDGMRMSNTYLLERRYQWSGICVEANPDYFKELTKNRRVKCVNICLSSDETTVDFAKRGVLSGMVSTTDNFEEGESYEVIKMKSMTLDTLLRTENAPKEIDYLSIDIEGAEEKVLGNFNFDKYRFKCITIERPTDFLRKRLKDYAYVQIKEIPGLDCFFIHESFIPQYYTNLFDFYWKKFAVIRWR